MNSLSPFPVLFGLLISLAGLLMPAAFAVEELADLIERAERSVVRIDVIGHDEEWLGSGFVVESNGVIFTNQHVMDGAVTAKAVFQDGRSFDVVGTKFLDAEHDIAVIKINAENLPVLPIADDLPRKGETVIALGSPHGLSFSASQGIISAIRDLKAEEGVELASGVLLQTTTPISQGNSGGPLINTDGIVVGMNTLVSTVGQNLNFAVSCVELNKANASQVNASVTPLAISTSTKKSKPAAPEKSNEVAVTDQAIRRYVEETKRLESGLKNDVARRIKQTTDRLGAAKRAKVGEHRSLPMGRSYVISEESKGRIVAFCRTEIDKEKLIIDTTEQLDDLKALATALKDSDPQKVLFELARTAGPPLAVRQIGEVGCIREFLVADFTLNKAVIAVSSQKSMVVVIVGEPIDRFQEGDEISPFLGFVSGLQAISIGNRVLEMVTVRRVADEQLASSVFGAGSVPSDIYAKATPSGAANSGAANSGGSHSGSSMPGSRGVTNGSQPPLEINESELLGMFKADVKQARIWTDPTGKFQIKAFYISQDDRQVILRREDNRSLLVVPKEKLSTTDRQFLVGLE